MAVDRSRRRGGGTETTPTAKPRSDAYTGILVVSLLAQIAGAVFLYLDWSQYPTDKPSMPSVASAPAAPGPGPGPAPVPGPGPGPGPGPVPPKGP